MSPIHAKLRRDALDIWQAGVDAVRSDQLVRDNIQVEGNRLLIGNEVIDLNKVQRIVVVGAGKAGAGMAAGLEEALGTQLATSKQLTGWVNVPADCVRELSFIHLHGARPAGVNEPTPAGVEGTQKILELATSLGPQDLCLCLISGGGSALMPAPAVGISLADKQAVTKSLSAAGANIEQLNIVRKQISAIKGGGLARACGSGRLISLIISDVLGDPLDAIASGPTVTDMSTPQAALKVIDQFSTTASSVPAAVVDFLRKKKSDGATQGSNFGITQVTNIVLGNNAVAVEAAGAHAEKLGYRHAMTTADRSEGLAEDVGSHLANLAMDMLHQSGPNCLITGGEPVVQLVEESQRGRGGRNQQLVLAALDTIVKKVQSDSTAGAEPTPIPASIVLLSGGTDGEDGPTDAAGAVIDTDMVRRTIEQNLNISEYLHRNDAYGFFEPLDGLILSGPTHTNVCDLRVLLVEDITK